MLPNSRVKFLVKMTDYRDRNNAYMYHCYVLKHKDDGMMGQFVVTYDDDNIVEFFQYL